MCNSWLFVSTNSLTWHQLETYIEDNVSKFDQKFVSRSEDLQNMMIKFPVECTGAPLCCIPWCYKVLWPGVVAQPTLI